MSMLDIVLCVAHFFRAFTLSDGHVTLRIENNLGLVLSALVFPFFVSLDLALLHFLRMAFL
jgi:hypothetical protein